MENWKIRIRCLCSRFRRVRHRNGYGVHSPFAYNFIKSVVYERGQYYAYPALAAARRKAAGEERELTPRSHRLLFRVANFVQPASAAVVSPHGALSAAYIQAGSVHAAVTVADAPESLKEGDYISPPSGSAQQLRPPRRLWCAAAYAARAGPARRGPQSAPTSAPS